MPQSFNLAVLAAGIVLILLSLTYKRFSAWGFNIEGPKKRAPRIIAFVLGIIMTATAIVLELESHSKNAKEKIEERTDSSEQQLHQFIVGRWTAHHVETSTTGLEYDSTLIFSKEGTYSDRVLGRTPEKLIGTWKVTPISSDTFRLLVTLPGLGDLTWNYTVKKLDRNSFKNEEGEYTAYRVSD